MSTLRERIDAALKAHGVEGANQGHICGPHFSRVNLLNDLVAASQQPAAPPTPTLTQESLQQLWDAHENQYGSVKAWKQAMQEVVWRWATGQEQVPVKTWCHPNCPKPWRWDGSQKGWIRVEIGQRCGEYVSHTDDLNHFCDACGAPRPTETG